MNNIEIEKKYQEQKAKMQEKYAKNIAAFGKYHDVDMSVAWNMFRFNAEQMYKGVTKEIIPGGGAVDMNEVIKDFAVLAECTAAFDRSSL